jgi:ABC-type glycerol-3-phosphate transport system substrate-binding protein
MKQKFCLVLMPIAFALIFLAGFLILVPASPGIAHAFKAEAQSESVTITYWHPQTGDRQIFMDALIEEFNASNPYNIVVVGESLGSYGAITNQVIDGLKNNGVLPNVVVAYPNSFADFARYGRVRFIDDYLADPTIGITDTADFYAGVLDYYRLGEYGNQLAGIQNGRSIELMYYNADMLANEGLSVPATWEAFETACISITSETVSGTIVGTDASRFATWLWSRGGELLSADLNTARFDEKPGIDALKFFQDLIDAGYARLPSVPYEENAAFGNGQIGFAFGSSSGIPFYRDSMENGVNNDWGVAPVPAVPGNEVVDSYGAGQGILHHDEESDRAAWLFIKWLTAREQTARWAAVSGYFPIRASASTHISMTIKMAEDLQYAEAFGLLGLGRSEPGIRGYDAVRNIINNAVVDTLQNGADVTATLQSAASEANAILATSGPDSAVIPPAGGTLVYSNTQGVSAMVEFPPGALVVTETVSYVPLEDLPTDGLAFALVPNLTFSQPVTITLQYRDEDIIGMDEDSLVLYNYDWSRSIWVDADPCGGYVRKPAENILQAAVCHFSDYALMEAMNQIFLPIIINVSQ